MKKSMTFANKKLFQVYCFLIVKKVADTKEVIKCEWQTKQWQKEEDKEIIKLGRKLMIEQQKPN